MRSSESEIALKVGILAVFIILAGIILTIWNDIKNFAHSINAEPWSIVTAITVIIIAIFFAIYFRRIDAYISKLIPLMAVLYAIWNVLVSIGKNNSILFPGLHGGPLLKMPWWTNLWALILFEFILVVVFYLLRSKVFDMDY